MNLLRNRRPMPPSIRGLTANHRTLAATICALLLLAPGASGAAEAWRSSFSVTPVWQGNAQLAQDAVLKNEVRS